MTDAVPIEPVAAAAPPANAEIVDDAAQRYRHARQMIADAIDSHVGEPGQPMLERLERTSCVHDLHDLLPDFAKALVKRVGLEPATPIISSIERLISGK
jgi:hypothetical protein